MKTRAIQPELLQSLDGLYRCNAASTVSFLCRWLRMIRTQICRGYVILVPDHERSVLRDLPEFYDWMSRRYPRLDLDSVRRLPPPSEVPCTVEWSDWHGEEAC